MTSSFLIQFSLYLLILFRNFADFVFEINDHKEIYIKHNFNTHLRVST